MDRQAGEEAVAAAVIEVKMRVDHDRDAAHEFPRQRVRRRVPLLVQLGRRVDHPVVDEDEPIRMFDRVDEAGPCGAVEDSCTAEVDADIVTTEHGPSIWRRRPKTGSTFTPRTTAR